MIIVMTVLCLFPQLRGQLVPRTRLNQGWTFKSRIASDDIYRNKGVSPDTKLITWFPYVGRLSQAWFTDYFYYIIFYLI